MKAFTILEVLLGILLFLIISLLVIQGALLVNTEFKTYYKKISLTAELIDFITFIETDIVKSNKVFEIEKDLLSLDFDKHTIKYSFRDTLIVRSEIYYKNTVTDTFKIISNLTTEDYIDSSKGESLPLVKMIQIDFDEKYNLPPVFTEKYYSQTTLFNH